MATGWWNRAKGLRDRGILLPLVRGCSAENAFAICEDLLGRDQPGGIQR